MDHRTRCRQRRRLHRGQSCQCCCISPSQRCPFGGSTGAPRHCFGAPDLLEQKKNGLGKFYVWEASFSAAACSLVASPLACTKCKLWCVTVCAVRVMKSNLKRDGIGSSFGRRQNGGLHAETVQRRSQASRPWKNAVLTWSLVLPVRLPSAL